MQKITLMLIPLGILFLLATLSMLGLGTTTADFAQNITIYDTATAKDLDGNYLYLYDANGNAKCYWNGTDLGDGGIIVQNDHMDDHFALWRNSTNYYELYFDQAAQKPVRYDDVVNRGGFMQSAYIQDSNEVYYLSSSLSWVIIIGVIMTISTIAGIGIFGSGLSDVSVKTLLVGTFAITIWTILTFMAYPLILEGGFYIYIAYGILGFMYMVGTALTMAGD